jgi:hypothetical protein
LIFDHLVHPPALADRAFLTFAESGFQLRRELLDPAVNTGMVDFDATLCHHLFQIPVAERIGQGPAHAGQDEVLFKLVAFELNHVGLLEGR